MSTKNKETLIKQNSDLNISDFDKELNYDALKGIVSAKRNYNKAKDSGDKVGMAKANAYANNIRRQSGSYIGGDDGSAYYPVQSAKKKERPEYKSDYSEEIDRLYEKISKRDDFSYDIDTDPLFALYKKVYAQAGDHAYERALASAAAKTGGIANTNAISAAAQAKAYYNSQLAGKATDMYNDAYEKYNDQTKEMYNQLNMLKSLESDNYEKYLDEAKAFESDRAYDYEKYVDDEKSLIDGIRYDVETAYQKSRDDEKDRQWQSEFDYRALRDAISDEQWQTKADTDRYNVVARLIQSVYNKSNIGVNIDRIMRILGLE